MGNGTASSTDDVVADVPLFQLSATLSMYTCPHDVSTWMSSCCPAPPYVTATVGNTGTWKVTRSFPGLVCVAKDNSSRMRARLSSEIAQYSPRSAGRLVDNDASYTRPLDGDRGVGLVVGGGIGGDVRGVGIATSSRGVTWELLHSRVSL